MLKTDVQKEHRRSKKKQRKRGFRVFENLGVKHR